MNRLLHALRAGPYARSKPHSHWQWEFGWYLQGQGRGWIGSQSFAIHPGMLVCYPPQVPHYETTSEPLVGIFLIIDSLSSEPPQTIFDEGLDGVSGKLCELMRSQSEIPQAAMRRMPQLLLEALLVHLQSRQQPSKVHPLVEQMQRIILERSDDPAFTVADASADLPISRDHVRRLFTQEIGCTPVQYLRDLRIQRAQGLLAMGRSVKQSSSECGFDDPYYFSRVFRSVTGQSPSAWREQPR
jgi:AraC-like DNA-binding protein